jgi:hypothetical protein
MEDRGPLIWEPVHLLPIAAQFVLTDSTEGQAAYGPCFTSTKDGLVRVEKTGQHIGRVKQRYGLWWQPTAQKSYVGHCPLGWLGKTRTRQLGECKNGSESVGWQGAAAKLFRQKKLKDI